MIYFDVYFVKLLYDFGDLFNYDISIKYLLYYSYLILISI